MKQNRLIATAIFIGVTLTLSPALTAQAVTWRIRASGAGPLPDLEASTQHRNRIWAESERGRRLLKDVHSPDVRRRFRWSGTTYRAVAHGK